MAKTRKRIKTTKTDSKPVLSPLVIGIVVVVSVLLVGGLVWLGTMGRNVGDSVDLSQFPAKGNPDAPVTMIEFSDFGCPHCRSYILDKSDQLEADYVDTGKVRYIVHPFTLGSPETALAAEAAWCAADQGNFFDYQRILFENQGVPLNQGTLSTLAGEAGLDSEALTQCLSSGTHRVDVENARRDAVRQGIRSTPTLFINNQRVEGNQPYEVFQQVIEQELAIAQ